jgi:cytidine deaminase
LPAVTSEQLIEAARAVRERAHAPFSKFKVGAAVEDEDGCIYPGCNVESASYGLTMCAERVAVFRAISEGASKLVRMAVVADTEQLTPPCGACRQVLWEFLGDSELILTNLSGATKRLRISQIFPQPFDKSFL